MAPRRGHDRLDSHYPLTARRVRNVPLYFGQRDIRCPSLRLDPGTRRRLVEIIANLRDRIQEAKLSGWLGEIEGLNVSLEAASRKLVSLDRMRDRQPAGPVNLGIPVITDPR